MAAAAKPKVLFVCHNHPAIRPGGAEGYALDLYEAIRAAGEFEPFVLARVDKQDGDKLPNHEATPITPYAADSNQYFLFTDLSDWDWLFGRYNNKAPLVPYYRDLLNVLKPDIVHFQHTIFIGYDAVRVTRNTLPQAPIVYMLHEYMPICLRNGQMVRVHGDDVCERSSPRRCHECYPHISMPHFFMRERFVKSQLSHVDLFLTPSAYARERYIDWGVKPESIRAVEHGLRPVQRLPEEEEERPRNRFAFFGQFTPTKGADVFLEAVKRLGDDFDGHVSFHGANLEMQPTNFRRKIERLLEATAGKVSLSGSYDHSELPQLMQRIDWVVVPSIWWETGPLVVPEAFLFGRPVICSDIGGMSERVTDGVNGMHFHRADPDSLAEVMLRASRTPGLWERMKAAVPPVQTMDAHAQLISSMYRELLDRSRSETPSLSAASA
jgi:glycosyltransferase involved in cell wall biosynthesis